MNKKIIRNIVLCLYALAILLPLSIIFFATFKDGTELFQNIAGLPRNFSLDNYYKIFVEEKFVVYFLNSIQTTLTSVFLTLFFGSLAAYFIIRCNKILGIIIFALFAAGMMIPPQVNMIPLYNLISSFGLKNKLTGLIIANIASTLPVAVFILTGFMRSIHKELFGASKVDGANEWKIYSRVVMPLSLPSLSATGIFLFVMHWNDLLYPLLFITKRAKKTVPLALLDFQGQYVIDYQMLFTGVAIASIPMVLMYLFFQRYFIAGMSAGAVKG